MMHDDESRKDTTMIPPPIDDDEIPDLEPFRVIDAAPPYMNERAEQDWKDRDLLIKVMRMTFVETRKHRIETARASRMHQAQMKHDRSYRMEIEQRFATINEAIEMVNVRIDGLVELLESVNRALQTAKDR